MPKYVCWGEHEEDLSELVRQKYGEGRPDVGLVPQLTRRRAWKIVVQCSEKHKNVFEGEGEP